MDVFNGIDWGTDGRTEDWAWLSTVLFAGQLEDAKYVVFGWTFDVWRLRIDALLLGSEIRLVLTDAKDLVGSGCGFGYDKIGDRSLLSRGWCISADVNFN